MANDTSSMYNLSIVDYIVLFAMLLLSASTGVYHALFSSGKQRTTHEYLLGNRQLGAFPVGVSVFISVISAVTFIGTPAEVYVNGPTFWLTVPSLLIVGLVITRTYIPVFYRLQVTSIYEYLEKRFNKTVRMIAVVISLLFGFIYMSFVIYAPALAISSITDLSLDVSILIMGLVCTFYSTLGGIKAVIWADVLQALIMVIGLILVLILGCVQVGGVDEVIKRLQEGNRDDFVDFRGNLTIRHSFWAIMIGGVFQAVYTSGVNQLVVQRNLSCKTERQAGISAWIGVVGVGLTRLLACACGLVMFAYYAECDPQTAGRIEDRDQTMALFIVDLVRGVGADSYGVSGLILSAVFSASLSTVSSGVNSVAANISEDLIKPHFKYRETCLTWTTKVIAACCGLITIGLAYIAPLISSDLLESVLAFVGILSGPLLGVFSLGMFIPWSNSKGAIIGLFFGALLGYWFLFSSFIFSSSLTDQLDFINSNCTVGDTMTSAAPTTSAATTTSPPEDSVPDWLIYLASISYMYFGCFTCLLTVSVGAISSLLTGPMDPASLDPDLFCPLVKSFCCCLPDRCTSWCCSSVGRNFDPKSGYVNDAFEVEANGQVETPIPRELYLNETTIDTRF